MNIITKLAGVFLLAFGLQAQADIKGGFGVASDNYFRGHNISDGFGYSVGGSYDWKGINGGVNLISLADDADGDHLMIGRLGYGLDIGGLKVKLSYNDYSYQGGDADGWEEFGVAADLGMFGFKYHIGLDDAGDFYAIHSDILKVARLEYGDWDDGGSYWKVSKGWDAFGGRIKLGYIDHEDSDADSFDVDNFFVGYSYKF